MSEGGEGILISNFQNLIIIEQPHSCIAGKELPWADIQNGTVNISADLLKASGITDAHLDTLMARFAHYVAVQPHSPGVLFSGASALSFAEFGWLHDRATFLGSFAANDSQVVTAAPSTPGTGDAHVNQPQQRCSSFERLSHNMQKHVDEFHKMQDVRHMDLIPLVESALAVMRLSCEKYFVLISVFVSYLLFPDPPPLARMIIRLNSRLSTIFQKVILFSFPAVCWVYSAGFIFSTFVSVVFW